VNLRLEYATNGISADGHLGGPICGEGRARRQSTANRSLEYATNGISADGHLAGPPAKSDLLRLARRDDSVGAAPVTGRDVGLAHDVGPQDLTKQLQLCVARRGALGRHTEDRAVALP
jgi:hypothetical protein